MLKNECSQLFKNLCEICLDNATYFSRNSSNNEPNKRLNEIFRDLKNLTDILEPLVDHIAQLSNQYDFDVNLKANGFRSFVTIANFAIEHTLNVSKRISNNRNSFLFRRNFYIQEIQSCRDLMENLKYCFEALQDMHKLSINNELFIYNHELLVKVINQLDTVNLAAFYGRCLGFQFYESVKNVVKFIVMLMSGFSEMYYDQGSFLTKTFNSVWKSGKYLFNPEYRAERVVGLYKNADIHFCKAFWFLAESELMHFLPSLMLTSLPVNRIVSVPPEKLVILNKDDIEVDIPIPSSHIGLKPLQVRLISSHWRKGMIGFGESHARDLLPSCPYLLIHCHGGGFVAHSSKAHLSYLKDWAKTLNVPILSIDYNLAPYAPYPRALEEVFYAYAWALKNSKLLGSTGRVIVLAGDSAGANLIIGISMKCHEFRIRMPNAMFLAYVPILVNFILSPARMMSIMDPILPFGFLLKCMKAYAAEKSDESDKLNNDNDDEQECMIADNVSNDGKAFGNSQTSSTLTNAEMSSFKSINEISFDVEMDASEENISEIDDQETDEDGNISNDSNAMKLVNMMSIAVSDWLNKNKNCLHQNSCLNDKSIKYQDLINFQVSSDFFLSPFLAPDDILTKLPKTHILTSKFDPCLDDCVMFAKKLRILGNQISLDVLDGLPHGFLNLTMVSKEAYEASQKCADIIASLFKFDQNDI